ncbi:MAG: GTP 3',8-cyclase MoaA [Bacteroidetes bacterium]|nr:GTP 3',8-cyclase MoaA [Bacteroidota bacterium]
MNHSPIEDKFGRIHNYLRLSLTDKCNLRCKYCMPTDVQFMPHQKLLTTEEIAQAVRIFVDMGVNKIRLTGGEPMVRKEFPEIVEFLGSLPVKLAITTNGYYLDKYLHSLKKAGLTRVNISLDTLRKDRFYAIVKRDHFDRCRENISLALDHGFDVKINIVVMKNTNDDEILDFIRWSIKDQIQVRFIEFMPFYHNQWDLTKTVGAKEILDIIAQEFEFQPVDGDQHDTARNYQVEEGKGTFGIISTVTAPFCDGCNRIRLTADGKLKNCLFAVNELDILTPLRQGEDIKPLIYDYFWKKKASLGGLKKFTDPGAKEDYERNRGMVAIGG